MIPMPLSDVAVAVGEAAPNAASDVVIRRVCTDSREALPGDLFVAIRGQCRDGHEFIDEAIARGAIACVVAQEGVALASSQCSHRQDAGAMYGGHCPPYSDVPFIRVADTTQALGRLAAYYRRRIISKSTRVIAVTGSNGKTTTKQMIDHVLSAEFPGRASPRSFNNNIGVPLTLLSVERGDRYVVVEIGTNAPGEVALLAEMASPDIAIITSIGEAHLEGLATIEAIVAEKTSLLEHVRPGGLAIVNVDRAELRRALRTPTHARLMTFGRDPSASHRVTPLESALSGTTFTLGHPHRIALRLPGVHHASNAAAAWLVGRAFDLPAACMIERLGSFAPGTGRARLVEVGGVSIVDDAYNANPASMLAAVETLALIHGTAQEDKTAVPIGPTRTMRSRRVLVMGDMLELGPQSLGYHERVLGAAVEAGIEVVVTVGEQFTEAARAKGMAANGSVASCVSADDVARTLVPMLARGDTVWIKGSRAMALDRAVRDLERSLGDAVVVGRGPVPPDIRAS